MSTVQGPTVIFGAEFPGLAQGAGEFDKIRKGAERARDQFGRFVKAGNAGSDAVRQIGALAPAAAAGLEAIGDAAPSIKASSTALDGLIAPLRNVGRGLSEIVPARTVAEFERLADEIEGTTDGFDKLRNAVDATGDTVRIFGRGASQMADLIEDNISDPALRAAENLRQLRIQQTLTARAGRAFADGVGVLKVRMAEMVGGAANLERVIGLVKGAMLGAAAAIAGGFVAAIGLAIEGNKKLKRDFGALVLEAKRFVSALGQIVLGLLGFDEGMRDVTKSVKGLTDAMVKNQGTIREQVASTLEIMSEFVRYLGNAFLTIKFAVFDLPKAGLQSLALSVNVVFALLGKLSEKIAELVVNAGTLLVGIGEATGNQGAIKRGQELQVKGLQALGKAMLSTQQSMINANQYAADFNSTLDGMVQQMLDVDAAAEKMKAAAGKVRESKDIAVDTSGLGPGGAPSAALAGPDVDAGFAGGFADIEKELERAREIAEIGKRNAEALASMDVQSMVLDAQLGRLASGGLSIAVEGFMNLAGAIGTAFGEMIVGTQTLEGFGRALVGVVADMANQFGSLFLLIGTGLAFIPGMGGWSAGLIGAGIGLKALGAGLGAVASGEVGGRGGSRGSGGGGATIDPSRFLRPERSMEPSVTNLKVVILGEEIEKPVTRFMDDVARRGGFRNLATRT